MRGWCLYSTHKQWVRGMLLHAGAKCMHSLHHTLEGCFDALLLIGQSCFIWKYQDKSVHQLCDFLKVILIFLPLNLQWYPQARSYCRRAPIILVGTNKELREDAETLKKLREDKLAPITYSQGCQMQKEIGAYKYVECSAVTHENVKLLFEEAIRSVSSRIAKKWPHQ